MFDYLKKFSTSGPKAGDDKRKEGEEEGGGGGKEGDLDSLVELVGQEDEEHQERHHQETVAQGRVGRGPSVILRRYPLQIWIICNKLYNLDCHNTLPTLWRRIEMECVFICAHLILANHYQTIVYGNQHSNNNV